MKDQLINKNTVVMSNNKLQLTKSKMIVTTLLMVVLSFFFSTNATAETGDVLFKNNCGACHKITDEDGIGPGLAGITEKRSEEWLMSWIKNSGEMIEAGDADAVAIFEEYNKMTMPGFAQFSDADLKAVVDYLADPGAGDVVAGGGDSTSTGGGAAAGPDETKDLRSFLFWGILVLAFILFYFFFYTKKVKKLASQDGVFHAPHRIKNYPLIFFIVIGIIALCIFLLYEGLATNIGHINGILFATFPYVAFAIFIIGSIYRYSKKGYKVSSLSTQFLEGKKLFWGSQPFHWGLLVLFFGHLIAFLFPSAVLAWNGQPMRLLILEISSFAFGLLALLGLILLIKRRLTTKTLLVVTNKMDMVVYGILLTQIVSGIGVAFFVRWGSSWFAAVLTPYLRSVFSFNPDIAAVSESPILVQIHIISAFMLIAIIPFTRFMHFLVAPIDYIWRKYQLVIWNWNRTKIRSSKRHFFGKKPRNH